VAEINPEKVDRIAFAAVEHMAHAWTYDNDQVAIFHGNAGGYFVLFAYTGSHSPQIDYYDHRDKAVVAFRATVDRWDREDRLADTNAAPEMAYELERGIYNRLCFTPGCSNLGAGISTWEAPFARGNPNMRHRCEECRAAIDGKVPDMSGYNSLPLESSERAALADEVRRILALTRRELR
jgi:hypothetical protein